MTTVDIANFAIQLCGSEAVLITLNDVNKEARLCRQNYDQARRATLQRHPWKFSIVRALVSLDSTETPAFGYTGKYLLPEDYIRVVSLNDQYSGDWVREGRHILYNSNADIQLRYVSDIEEIEFYDPLFIDAFVAELASRICYPIAQSSERLQMIQETAKHAIKLAKRSDAIEQSALAIEATLYDEARLSRGISSSGR